MKILLTGPLPDWFDAEIKKLGHTLTNVAANAMVDQDVFAKAIPDYDVYISGGIEDCTAPVIEAGGKANLKAIVFLGVDYTAYIDAKAAEKAGVPIFNTPGANANAVAEWATALMLMAIRRAPAMLANMAAHKWQNLTGNEVHGKTLGLIGAGPIAQHMAVIGKGLGMEVIYWTRSGAKKEMKATYKSFDDVLQQADVLSIHVPKAAGEILGSAQIKQLKKGMVLVSTCAIKQINEQALYEALHNNHIAVAGFDGFYTEGDKAWEKPSKLMELGSEKFFFFPHAGWRSHEADRRMFEVALEKIGKLK